MNDYNEKIKICPVEYTLNVIGGKWKLLILYYLMIDKVKRYGELKRAINGITHKMLSQQLKELEAEGLINRKEYHQIPPKVEYLLSEKGVTLLPILGMMHDWGRENMGNAATAGYETKRSGSMTGKGSENDLTGGGK